MAITQRCPNCREPHDVSVYVSGQRIPCRRCGLKFDVVRSDVPPRASSLDRPSPAVAAPLPPRKAVVTAPWGEKADPPATAPLGVARPLPAFTSTPAARPAAREAQRSLPVSLEETAAPGAAAAPAGPTPPAIPGFELLAVVGRGGMGEVWRARQLSLGREVAIKTLASHLAEERDFVRRFEKEATALASLAHPNVVAIFDRGSAGGIYYLVMEFVAGPSLRERMVAGGLPPEGALEVIAQVLAAMEYAHGRGIVHRDLKPENILLAEGQLAKVADFGLAAILGRESSLQVTRPSVAMGTLSYMAPEQRRDAHAVDGRADLYSVAVILYELLTGELPLGRFQLPSRRAPKVDRRVDAVLEKALDPDPDARYQNARDLAAALAALDRGEPVASGLRGWLRRKRD
ncbi:MAG TPA: serine/threonine-protein kinase [Myxococcales bacterium]|nr:serine/threonine-protein kinase [Myxococcales bacterium]